MCDCSFQNSSLSETLTNNNQAWGWRVCGLGFTGCDSNWLRRCPEEEYSYIVKNYVYCNFHSVFTGEMKQRRRIHKDIEGPWICLTARWIWQWRQMDIISLQKETERGNEGRPDFLLDHIVVVLDMSCNVRTIILHSQTVRSLTSS